VTPWVRIAPDGTITILSAGAEMGQGSMTSLPLIVAEEMDADWARVAIKWTPADAEVSRHAVQGQRQRAICHRREAAGDGLRLDAAFACAQCPARDLGSGQARSIGGRARALERCGSQGDERRDRCRQAAERARRGGRPFRERQGRTWAK